MYNKLKNIKQSKIIAQKSFLHACHELVVPNLKNKYGDDKVEMIEMGRIHGVYGQNI